MIYLDTETCGLHGPIVLLQWAEDDGPINLHSVWSEPIEATMELIERICSQDVVGFNLSFDWFHICQLYTTLALFPSRDIEPMYLINEYADLEPFGRDGQCLKPKRACDIMLHARQGPYQSTMDRGDIRIKKVPTALAWTLSDELERRIPLKDIYFAKRKDKHARKWQIYDIENDDEEIDPDFKDIVLKFHPSSALKALAVDALKLDPRKVLVHSDIELQDEFYPVELGYAPFAKAFGDSSNWNSSWPAMIKFHISHWRFHDLARQYASDDVQYTRDLYKFFGSPEPGDDDSELACMVGAVRWRGFKVDVGGIQKLKDEALKARFKIVNDKAFAIPTAPHKARIYVTELMDETEKLVVADSTKRVLLEEISRWKTDCPNCKDEGCDKCANKGEIDHPAASRAAEVLAARKSNYEANLYDKFLRAGRFHASFVVIGALSSRMAGTDDLNAQGIKKAKYVRSKFPLAWDQYVLCGGDFDGFEVTLAEACYNDPLLRQDLLSGKKIHALFGVHVYPGMTYEEILATSGTSDDRYTRCKSAVFAMFYGGEGFTLKDRLGVDIETADKAYDAFCARYRGVGIARKKVFDMFCSMRQPGGIGSQVQWYEPSDYIESMFGFRRYFTLENTICRTLYNLANEPPKEWAKIKIKVQRRERVQTVSGAVQSALFAAAFALQASNMRAAANHVIQSSGATVTKLVQRKIWDIQPHGVNDWLVQPMNIHDEIQCPCKPEVADQVKQAVNRTVETIRPKVPLIKMEWNIGLTSWADK